jgi:spermidine synthase
VLHESRSAYNTLIVTEELPNVRALRFEAGGAYQSLVRLDDPRDLMLPYTRAAMTSLALVEAPGRILLVGLGGGAMPRFLRATFPVATIDVVEIDPRVIEVARDFFDFRVDERLRTHAADGREFVERAGDGYDLIFLDAYGAFDVPPHLTTLEFLQSVRRRLNRNGVVAANVWESDSHPLFEAMLRTCSAAFEQLCVLTVPQGCNRIVLARAASSMSIEQELVSRSASSAARLRLPFQLTPFLEHGCRDVKAAGGVLRD